MLQSYKKMYKTQKNYTFLPNYYLSDHGNDDQHPDVGKCGETINRTFLENDNRAQIKPILHTTIATILAMLTQFPYP